MDPNGFAVYLGQSRARINLFSSILLKGHQTGSILHWGHPRFNPARIHTHPRASEPFPVGLPSTHPPAHTSKSDKEPQVETSLEVEACGSDVSS